MPKSRIAYYPTPYFDNFINYMGEKYGDNKQAVINNALKLLISQEGYREEEQTEEK